MILGKIIRSGGLVASGVLLGSLLSYNSEKTEIFSGIESLKTSAIEKIRAKFNWFNYKFRKCQRKNRSTNYRKRFIQRKNRKIRGRSK